MNANILELAHYSSVDIADKVRISETVVAGTLASAYPTHMSQSDLQQYILNHYGIEVSNELIKWSLERLSRPSDEYGPGIESHVDGFSASPTFATRWQEQAENYRQVFRSEVLCALELLEHEFRNAREVDRIIAAFEQYIVLVFEKFGAQVCDILDANQYQSGSDTMAAAVTQLAAGFSDVAESIRNRFPGALYSLFWNCPDIVSLFLDSTIAFKGIVTTAPVGDLFKNTLKGTVFLVDTNVLFILAGFDRPDLVGSVRTLVKAGTSSGCNFYFVAPTVTEFQQALKAHAQHVPTDLFNRQSAKVARYLYLNGFESGLAHFVHSGGKPSDYLGKVSRAFDVLKSVGVERLKDIDALEVFDPCSEEEREEISALNQITDMRKDVEVLEHDARLRILVRRLRGGTIENFEQAHYFVLSTQARLLRYDRARRRKNPSEIPYCFTLSQFAYLLSATSPYVLEPDQRRNCFRSFFLDFSSQKLVNDNAVDAAYEILARAKSTDDLSEEVACKLAVDKILRTEISDADTPEKKESAFVNAVARARTGLQNEQRAKEKISAELLRQQEQMKSELEYAFNRIEKAEEEKKKLEAEVTRQREEEERQRRDREKLDRENQAQLEKARQSRKRHRRMAAGLWYALCTIFTIGIILILEAWGVTQDSNRAEVITGACFAWLASVLVIYFAYRDSGN